MANIVSKIQTNASTTYNITESNVNLAICSTAASTAAKTVTIPGFTSSDLVDGATVTVIFSNTNTATNPTLNVSGTGAKPIIRCGGYVTIGTTPQTSWYQAEIVKFIYFKGQGDSGDWNMERVALPNSSQLVDSVVYNNQTYYYVGDYPNTSLKMYFTFTGVVGSSTDTITCKIYIPDAPASGRYYTLNIPNVQKVQPKIDASHKVSASLITYDGSSYTVQDLLTRIFSIPASNGKYVMTVERSGSTDTYSWRTDWGNALGISGNTISLKNAAGQAISSINLPVWDGTVQ